MEYLISVDLEGIHGIVGEPYKSLTRAADYEASAKAACFEINAAAKALFDNGATKVAVYDYHGYSDNIDFSELDSRVIKIHAKEEDPRFIFAKEHHFTGAIFIGYHAKEGTRRAVMAHTFNSVGVQYVKLNGETIGEVGVDAYLCNAYGITPLLITGDDYCIVEAEQYMPEICGVVTKYGEGRNKARFRDREEILEEIYNGVSEMVRNQMKVTTPCFPEKASLEVRYTRAETAEETYLKVKEAGKMPVEYGCDSHTLCFEIASADVIANLL
ncbi:MAG: M55 family metallopeptidase [Clostridia bacterium]|nr:M55 family metallopeptidase [Clostridia bacterium]